MSIKTFFKSLRFKEKIQIIAGGSRKFKRRKSFYSSFVQKNDICFDVGANIGNRIEPLLAIGAKVVAVEPQEECYTILKEKFGDRIEIVTYGLAESECIKEFYLSDANTISSFSKDWIDSVKATRFKEYNWDNVVKVQMTTLDKLISRYGLPSFIKIDVEGYELEVLKGLTIPVKMISFEYCVPEQTTRIIDCLDRIEKISPNIECNYSVGEGMVFALKNWMPVQELKNHITTKNFIDTEFGDIYVRAKI